MRRSGERKRERGSCKFSTHQILVNGLSHNRPRRRASHASVYISNDLWKLNKYIRHVAAEIVSIALSLSLSRMRGAVYRRASLNHRRGRAVCSRAQTAKHLHVNAKCVTLSCAATHRRALIMERELLIVFEGLRCCYSSILGIKAPVRIHPFCATSLSRRTRIILGYISKSPLARMIYASSLKRGLNNLSASRCSSSRRNFYAWCQELWSYAVLVLRNLLASPLTSFSSSGYITNDSFSFAGCH